MDKEPLFDNVPDENLGELLYQLIIIDGHDEVKVEHPREGSIIVTKENYKKITSDLSKYNKLSPADQLIERKRVKEQHQRKHRSDMATAEFYTVDIQDEENFGYDINGIKIDMEGMTFIQVSDYLPKVKPLKNEFGAFVHPSNEKKPVRILMNIKDIK